MTKKMLINASNPEECRVAVVADGLLEELDIQVKTHEATLGNIYKGIISRVEPSLQAVFVDYGTKRNGFLSINDVHPSYFPESFESGRRRPRIQEVFKKDDHVMVQVNKEERHTKGASLTTNISLAGRYLVLMPGTDLYGVSRKIEDEKERKDLKEILTQLKPPENMGFIIRTAGLGRTKTELARDLDYLLKLWKSIEMRVADAAAPCLLHKEHDLVIRAIREHFSVDINEILVDDKDVFQKAREFFHQVMPKFEPLVKLSQEKRPLFNKYQLEEQIEQVYRRRIRLKSGGYILIEPTEALVTVDVNSGSSTKEKGVEETAFQVNMEAAPEIARQLRLRDLGGIIVVDFIDMSQKKHKQDVEKAIRAELKRDRAKTKILRISALGLLELSRQRIKSSLGTGEYLECPLCDGRGKIRSPETSALSVFRRIKSLLVKGDLAEVRVTVPSKVAEYLLNNMRSQLHELEKAYGTRVSILVRQALPDKEIILESIKEEAATAPSEHVPAMYIETRADEVEVLDEAAMEPTQPPAEAGTALKPTATGRRRGRKKPSPRKKSVQTLEEKPEGLAEPGAVTLEGGPMEGPPLNVTHTVSDDSRDAKANTEAVTAPEHHESGSAADVEAKPFNKEDQPEPAEKGQQNGESSSEVDEVQSKKKSKKSLLSHYLPFS